MKSLIFIFTLCFSLIASSCMTQDKDTRDKAEAFLKNKYDVSNLKWEIDDQGNLEGKFESGEKNLRADFTKNGDWIESEENIDWDELPEAIKNAIKDEFDKDDITEVERVEHHEKGLFYDVEFKDPGKNKDVEYREDGTKING